MKLWLLSQSEKSRYDTFDALVVAAKTEVEAQRIHPRGAEWIEDGDVVDWDAAGRDTWATKLCNVTVRYLGKAIPGTKAGIILASFNAG